MRSIWATSSVVWVIGSTLFLLDRKQVNKRLLRGDDRLISCTEQKLQSSSQHGSNATPTLVLVSLLIAAATASGVA